ncbi:hypothetical protein [Polyangium sp. y55x31]|uniref:hypothetical protein n=1 Tax=Polyangium sp. y55x31 TaxID=3042688 RepID=UPI0024823991|nr:hypothetical protein [Polyangium sp. y55x31]MDI1484653.1 hypothetical protein [Polyangium sp. y55x31]
MRDTDEGEHGGGVALDGFIQRNPALGAYSVFWMSVGYLEGGSGALTRATDEDWLPVFPAMFGLALLIPDAVRERLPTTANAKLSILLLEMFTEHPEWRVGVSRAIESWVDPFWKAIRLGVASGIFTMNKMRIMPLGKTIRRQPGTAMSLLATDLRCRSKVIGKMVRKDGGEAALLTLLAGS